MTEIWLQLIYPHTVPHNKESTLSTPSVSCTISVLEPETVQPFNMVNRVIY